MNQDQRQKKIKLNCSPDRICREGSAEGLGLPRPGAQSSRGARRRVRGRDAKPECFIQANHDRCEYNK